MFIICFLFSNKKKQNLTEAEEEIYKLHQDKLTLIKAFSTVQETKTSSLRSNHHSRN